MILQSKKNRNTLLSNKNKGNFINYPNWSQLFFTNSQDLQPKNCLQES